MKPIMRKEIIELVKKGDLKPDYLKPYREEEYKPIKSSEDKLIEAIYVLVAAIAKNDNSNAILEAIKNQPIPEVKVENIIEKEEKKPERWEFEVIKNENDPHGNYKIIAEAK